MNDKNNCKFGVPDGYINTLRVERPMAYIRECKMEAKYKITTENSRGRIDTMNVCERHKNQLVKRFKVLKLEKISYT